MAHKPNNKKRKYEFNYLKKMINKEKNNWGRTKNTLRQTMMEKSDQKGQGGYGKSKKGKY